MVRQLSLYMVLVVGGLYAWSWGAVAVTPFHRSLVQKQNKYMKDGVVVGGQAGRGASLLNVRRAFSPKIGLERVIVDMGDEQGNATSSENMGYFQVALESKRNRILVDLAQLRISKLSEPQIKSIFKKSPYVKTASLTLDPEDNTGTLLLELSRPVRLEVFNLSATKKTPRIVLDILPASAAERIQ